MPTEYPKMLYREGKLSTSHSDQRICYTPEEQDDLSKQKFLPYDVDKHAEAKQKLISKVVTERRERRRAMREAQKRAEALAAVARGEKELDELDD
jgi:hypothetical protein